MRTKNCVACGKLSFNHQKFCGKVCSKKVKRTCKRRGCTETWYASRGKRYCSRSCVHKSRKTTKVKQTCKRRGCTETWYDYKSNNKRYCSRTCVHKSRKTTKVKQTCKRRGCTETWYATKGYTKRYCSRTCAPPKVKRMCRRIGCTETWYATENSKKRWCSNGCGPNRKPIYPYRLNRTCQLCHERFTLEINSEEQRAKATTCYKCKALLNSKTLRNIYLIETLGLPLADVKRMDDDTINWLYENGLPEEEQPKEEQPKEEQPKKKQPKKKQPKKKQPKKKQPKKKQPKKKQIVRCHITDFRYLSEKDLLEMVWFSGKTE